jgi:uncharacterized protein YukE
MRVFGNVQVSQVNKELQDSLVPQSSELVERIASCRRQLEELRARVLKLAESFAVSTPTPEEIFSLRALESLLQDVTEAQEKKTKGEEVRQIAKSILSGTGSLDPTALRYLIWQLLCEDKFGLAFHLARYLEVHSPDLQPRLPSWLMRAVVVGRHMRYDVRSDEITKTLMTDFSNSDTCFVDGEGEWNQAVSLLLAASALRPALLAPNTGALEILHSLRLGEGLNQLHEYCQTIANCGTQLQPQYYQGSSNDYFQQQAQQLKQAVSNRQKAVMKELDLFEQRNSSVLLLAGICCCRTAVKDIQDSFRPRRCVTNS